MNSFEDFINQCASDAVNALMPCPYCLKNKIGQDESICFDCYERQQRRDQRNDAGVDEI